MGYRKTFSSLLKTFKEWQKYFWDDTAQFSLNTGKFWRTLNRKKGNRIVHGCIADNASQKRLFSQIVRIKAGADYTKSIGKDLGVIATANTVEHPIPEFTVTVELGATGPRELIDFKKYGHDGIWIESRINNGEWAFLAIDTVKPSRRKPPSPRQHPRNPRVPAALVGQERTLWRMERGAEGGGGGLIVNTDCVGSQAETWEPTNLPLMGA